MEKAKIEQIEQPLAVSSWAGEQETAAEGFYAVKTLLLAAQQTICSP